MMTINIAKLQDAVELMNDLEERKLAYIVGSKKLARNQKEQALMMTEYSINTAFRYSRFCEKKQEIKCPNCKSSKIKATLTTEKARYEKRHNINSKSEYTYKCLECKFDIKFARDVTAKE